MAKTWRFQNVDSDLDITGQVYGDIMHDTTGSGTRSQTAASGGGVTVGYYISPSGTSLVGQSNTGSFTVVLNVSTAASGTDATVALRRYNSSGAQQATVTMTPANLSTASTGDKSFSVTSPALGTWASGDRFVVAVTVRNTNAHGGSVGPTWDLGAANTRVDTPYTFVTDYPRSHSDTVTIGTDTPARLLAATRGHSDTTSVSESAAGTKGAPRSISDTTSVSESIARLLGSARPLTDTTSLSESLSRLLGAARPLADTTSLSESTGEVVDWTRTASDSLTTGDSLFSEQSGATNYDRFHSDTVSTSDSVWHEKRGISQFLAPVEDISLDSWVGEDNRTTNLYPSIADASDSTYIKSPNVPDSGDAATFRFESATDPTTGYGHVLRYRYAATGSTTLVVELLQGTTVLTSWSHVDPPSSPTAAAQEIPAAIADQITDYTALRVRFRGV